jgi:hypothetical protein
MVLHAEGLPLLRMVAVLVAGSDGRAPAVARAAATMLGPWVAAVVRLPHDPHIRAQGLRDQSRLHPRTRQAAALLADAVVTTAHAAWGERPSGR